MDHSNIIKTTSCYNAALVAEDTQKIFVESANFIKNFHKSNNPESASAILISNPAGNGYVQECNFLENTNEQGYIIYMQHLEMIVENCCFTKAKENREVNFQIKIVNSKIRNMCYTQTVRPNDVFGYVEPSENLMQKPNKGRNVSKSLQFSIMASILAVFIKYFWSNYVMHYILKPSKQIL
ncbi:hypothetical protein TVAGG3_0643560 [Trichomonas vaginalis G3]|uniref:hypothetical protein n=1 Tax=Trichomonas vaginalis (strain ATCC PRA-98 / G3) TaxID=412133 RepID=UPI0021E6020F|nr:hypothetical protein TVAGG3_0643560 [Trichomonas vaginalis G3]KAI5505346.1 hypothetical protein TVAGG3_0643560 [Trichomonas vaginalis G3]